MNGQVIMKISQIYSEFERGFDNEYYAKLASEDVMVAPVLVQIFLEDEYVNARWAMQLLLYISGNTPEIIYPYYSYIAKGLCSKNNFLAWNTWRILSKLTLIDVQDKFNAVKEKFYSALNSTCLSEYSIACECAVDIFAAKTDERDKILEIIKNSHNRIFCIEDEPIANSGSIADEKAEEFFEKIMNLDI